MKKLRKPPETKEPIEIYVPEVLSVHMNEIYKKITTIQSNKLKLKNSVKKKLILFSQQLIFHC